MRKIPGVQQRKEAVYFTYLGVAGARIGRGQRLGVLLMFGVNRVGERLSVFQMEHFPVGVGMKPG